MSITLSASERQKLKLLIAEITKSFLKIDVEREAIKDMVADASEEFDVEKKMIRKISTVMYKSNYPDVVSEQNDFEYLYEAIIEGKTKDSNVTTLHSALENN